jgi:hypothetical protein
MPFMYSLYKVSDRSETGNALAENAVEALHQIRDYRSKHGQADLQFKVSDDQVGYAGYVLEEQDAIPTTYGTGWTNDPSGTRRTIFVRVGAL